MIEKPREIVLIAHNIRSSHNVGSLLRTADGLNVSVFLTGYTPYPAQRHDARLPHVIQKVSKQIHKTALGAEASVHWSRTDDVFDVIAHLKKHEFTIAALEQTDASQILSGFKPPQKIALIVGREVEGIEPEVLKAADTCLEIPMLGRKESFNVTQAAAMALYQFRFL